MKRIILCILLLPAIVFPQSKAYKQEKKVVPKQPEFAEPILLGNKIDKYTYEYKGNKYLHIPRLGNNVIFQYGNMTPEEYETVRDQMFLYAITYDRNLFHMPVLTELAHASRASIRNHTWEGTADLFEFKTWNESFFQRQPDNSWTRYVLYYDISTNNYDEKRFEKYMRQNIASYMRPSKSPGIKEYNSHRDTLNNLSFIRMTKGYPHAKDNSFDSLYRFTTRKGDFNENIKRSKMPTYTDGYKWYQVRSDHSIQYGYLYPDRYKVWFNLMEDKTIESLGMIDKDDVKVYNEESPFIYVYDFERYREGTYDWYFHDRLAYGYEDDFSDDKSNPFEAAFYLNGKQNGIPYAMSITDGPEGRKSLYNSLFEGKRFNGQIFPRMTKLTYGPILDKVNHKSLVASRIFNHIKIELAKEYLVKNIHPGPKWNNLMGDYEYKGRPLTKDNRKLFPGFEEYSNVTKYKQNKAIELFQDKVRNMNVYDYWEGIDKTPDMIFDYYEKYEKAILAYNNNMKNKTNLVTAQRMARRMHLLEAYRDLYLEMAQRPATVHEKQEDHNAYFSENRLSMAMWVGSIGFGDDKHKADHTLKTAIPFFEGKDRPGKMGEVKGTRKFRYWVVGNVAGWLNHLLELNGHPELKYHMLTAYGFTSPNPIRGIYKYILRFKVNRMAPDYVKKLKPPVPGLHNWYGDGWLYIELDNHIPSPFGDGISLYDNRGTVWSRISKNRISFFHFTHKESPGIKEVTLPNGVITNTGGILHAGYVTGKNNIDILKKEYGTMEKAWKAAEKGPYMIVSSRTYNKLGHEYFEKKAGRKLFKADVTGAMVESAAKTIVNMPANDKKINELMKDPYFQINGKEAISNNHTIPDINYSDYKGKLEPIKTNINKTKVPKEITDRINEAIAEDEKIYPGCNITRLGYMINPDGTKGLLFLRLLKMYHFERTMFNSKMTLYRDLYTRYRNLRDKSIWSSRNESIPLYVGYYDKTGRKPYHVQTGIKSQRVLAYNHPSKNTSVILDEDKMNEFVATKEEQNQKSLGYIMPIDNIMYYSVNIAKNSNEVDNARYHEGYYFKDKYYNNLKLIQKDIISKRVPSFMANPHLFRAYYDLVEDIESFIYDEIQVKYPAQSLFYSRRDDSSIRNPLNFISYNLNRAVISTENDNKMHNSGIYEALYLNHLYGRTFYEKSKENIDNSRIESIVKRYIDDSFDKDYLNTRIELYVDRYSQNSSIYGAERSKNRVRLASNKVKSAFTKRTANNSYNGLFINMEKDYEFLNEIIGVEGVFGNIMLGTDLKNIYLPDLGTATHLYQQRRPDTYKEEIYEQLFPGIVKQIDSSGYYPYRNYCTYKAMEKKTDFWHGTITYANYSNIDYEPAIISEAYIRSKKSSK